MQTIVASIMKWKKQEEALFKQDQFLQQLQHVLGAQESVDAQFYFGEVAFVALNLKPCTMFTIGDTQSSSTYQQFFTKFYLPLITQLVAAVPHLRCMQFGEHVTTANYNLSHCYVLYNSNREDLFAQWNQNVVPNNVQWTEQYVAQLLDYPVAFPEDIEMLQLVQQRTPYQLVEWAYLLDGHLVLTTFVMRTNENAMIKPHAQRYIGTCKELLNWNVKVGCMK